MSENLSCFKVKYQKHVCLRLDVWLSHRRHQIENPFSEAGFIWFDFNYLKTKKKTAKKIYCVIALSVNKKAECVSHPASTTLQQTTNV